MISEKFQFLFQIITHNWFPWIDQNQFQSRPLVENIFQIQVENIFRNSFSGFILFFNIQILSRFINTKKVEKPDVVMAIHPRLEGEFWGPTVDLLLDENIKVVFTCFNKDHYEESLERLDYVFVKYIYKGVNTWVSGHTKQSPMDPNMIWASNQYLIVFQVSQNQR